MIDEAVSLIREFLSTPTMNTIHRAKQFVDRYQQKKDHEAAVREREAAAKDFEAATAKFVPFDQESIHDEENDDEANEGS